MNQSREKLAIRVVIADDHPIVQRGLKGAITSHDHLHVVATADNFRDLMEVLPTTVADILVLDLNGMGSAPLPLMERLKRDYPNLGIVVFSSLVDCVPELLRAGAYGYVVKGEREHHLITAIELVHRGKQFLSPLAEEYVLRFQD